MDQWSTNLQLHQQQHHLPNSLSDPREMSEVEAKDTSDARKVQKADREKLRRDRLNDQFIELGNLLDPDRPKNDKASIIIDTIQVLKDLATQVNRLKAECSALSEESRELTQEKNELRDEKSSLKSDIENLNTQYQQRVGVMFPWGGINPSSVVMPPPYSFPVGPLPMHPFPFFANHNPPAALPMPYPNPHINHTIPVYTPTSYSNEERGENCSDVVTELQLKTPGSRSGQELSGGDKNGKCYERKERSVITDGDCSSSRYTSSNSEVDDDINE